MNLTELPKRTRIGHALFFISLILGAFFRLYAIDTIPGFEHDEALVCLGAQLRTSGSDFPLTGDKVYEGPLLELILAGNFSIFGSGLHVARITMGIIGLLSLIVLYLTANKVSGPLAGGITVLLASTAPTLIASSRVIYTCNLTYILLPLSLYFYLSYSENLRFTNLVLSAVFLGLAGHARLTNIVLLFPMSFFVFIFESNIRKKILGSFVCLLTVGMILSPIVLYNLGHHWPIGKVFFDPVQGHSMMGHQHPIEHYCRRLIGYGDTLLNALNGKRFWIDVPDLDNPNGGIFVAIIIIGIGIAIKGSLEKQAWKERISLTLLGTMFLTVPMITKTISPGTYRYQPHYLDVVLPFIFILSGASFSRIFQKYGKNNFIKAFFIFFMLLGIFFNGHFLVKTVYAKYRDTGGPGRWRNVYQKASVLIKEKFEPSHYSLVMNYQFEKGYPQFKFLLSEYEVFPYLGVFQGIHYVYSKPKYRRIITVLNENEKSLKRFWKKMSPIGNSSYFVCSTTTPQVYINGYFVDHKNKKYDVTLAGEMIAPDVWKTHRGLIKEGSNIYEVEIANRIDVLSTDPTLNKILYNVTPRHVREMVYLNNFVTGFEISCRTENDTTIFLFWSLGSKEKRVTIWTENNKNMCQMNIWNGDLDII